MQLTMELVIPQNKKIKTAHQTTLLTTYFIMFVKNTLKEKVSVVVKLCGAVWRDLYPAIWGKAETI